MPNSVLLPLASGFVIGLAKKNSNLSWMFLVTAKHVVANQSEIIIRVNAVTASNFICRKLVLRTQDPGTNVLLARAGVDLAAIQLPDIEGYSGPMIPVSSLLDDNKIKDLDIGIGTEVTTVGYLYSYSGQKMNYPVAKFGHVSLLSSESRYASPESTTMEQGYVLDLSNAPGLSGSPVFTYGVEFDLDPFRYRVMGPYVVGVIKGMMLAPANGYPVSQGVAVIEPGPNLKDFMKQVRDELKTSGGDVEEIN